MIKKLAIISALAIIGSNSAHAAGCEHFDTIPVGTEYRVGDTIPYPAGNVTFQRFKWSNGTFTTGGYATVVDQFTHNAHGIASPELNLNNIKAHWVMDPEPASLFYMKYSDSGGNVNLYINGFLANVDNLSQLNGRTIGGVEVEVSQVNEANQNGQYTGMHGTVTLVGEIERFGIGGQEFRIDDVCGVI